MNKIIHDLLIDLLLFRSHLIQLIPRINWTKIPGDLVRSQCQYLIFLWKVKLHHNLNGFLIIRCHNYYFKLVQFTFTTMSLLFLKLQLSEIFFKKIIFKLTQSRNFSFILITHFNSLMYLIFCFQWESYHLNNCI